MDIEKLSNLEIAEYLRNKRNCALILWTTTDVIKVNEKQAINMILKYQNI